VNPVTLASPAKINLYLKVLGKRPDGYHDLESLMCRVNLCDTLGLSFDTPAGTTICDHPDVPDGAANLAQKAASVFFEALSTPGGVTISIHKKIPVAAGLGGGSSNAATVFHALNAYYDNPFSTPQLMDMGLQIGADVPFFLFEHSAVAKGVGESLEACPGMFPFWVVLVNPRITVSTAWVFEHLNLGLTNCPETYNVSGFLEDPSRIKGFLCNDLEKVTIGAFPVISAIKGALLDYGAEGALMSGSGPTVFGLFSAYGQAHRAYEAIQSRGCWDTYLADLLLP